MSHVVLFPFAGWAGAVQAAAQDAPIDREFPWVFFLLLALYIAAAITALLVLEYRQRRLLIRLPFSVRYDLTQLAEREGRSPGQQALVLLQEALGVGERARYGGIAGSREGGRELRRAV
jgi:hypothetical protein